MQIITVDKKGYVTGLYIGECPVVEHGIEVELPFEPEELFFNIGAYRYVDGDFVKDEEAAKALADERQLQELRSRRQSVCFPVINRGQLWYAQLTEEQNAELSAWYRAWLDVTISRTVPETPEWISRGL